MLGSLPWSCTAVPKCVKSPGDIPCPALCFRQASSHYTKGQGLHRAGITMQGHRAESTMQGALHMHCFIRLPAPAPRLFCRGKVTQGFDC